MGYLQTNLVSDLPGVAAIIDPNLMTPWGMAFAATSPFWISDNRTDVATLYNGDGSVAALVVSMPAAAPTGDVFNPSSTSFKLANANPARFLFATQSGQIVGWNGGTSAVIGFTATDGAIYTGLASATVGVGDVLFAADFRNGKIDVINSTFSKIFLPGNFTDPNLPAGFSPYNVQVFGGQLYVTYAKFDPVTGDAQAAPNSGFVNVFNLDGTLSRRLASSSVDAPWGLAMAPSTFGKFGGDLLVGNHGDGTISAFDPATGAFLGQLLDPHGNVVRISGLRALDFGNSSPSFDPNTLYFDAGLTGGTDGLFGKLQAVPAVSNDFNGDGFSDLLWRDSTSGQVANWTMSNGTISNVAVLGAPANNWQIAGTGDVSGDGTSDIVWHDTAGDVAIWTMSGGHVGNVAVIGAATTNWQIAGIGDFNGGGTADILWHDNTGKVAVWTMNGGHVTNVAVVGAATTNWQIAGVGDFNGDGTADILWHDNTGKVAVWTMNGGHVTNVAVVGAATTNWQIAATGEVTGDGTSDVIWRDSNSGAVAVWKMVNGAIASNGVSVIGSASTNWQITGTGDVNVNGTPDIIWHDNTSGSAAEWLMANGTVSQVLVPGLATTNWQIVKTG